MKTRADGYVLFRHIIFSQAFSPREGALKAACLSGRSAEKG